MRKEHGIATLEMLIALTIITITISSVILLVFEGQSGSVNSETHQEALYKAQMMIEASRAFLRSDFDSAVSIPPSKDGIYTKELIVNPVKNGLAKQLIGKVTWGTDELVQLSTIVANWNSGDTCSQTISGDFKHLRHYDFYSDRDLVSQATGNTTNGLGIADVKVYRNTLYLAARISPDGNTFYVFNLPDDLSKTPVYQGRTVTTGSSINAIALAPNDEKLYVDIANAKSFNFTACATNTQCPQFQTIDASDPKNPAVVSTANLKMPVTGSGGQGVGKSIFQNKNYAYLGLVKPATGPEFNIIDVQDPLHPTRVGGYTVGRTINAIYVKDNYAYVATDDNARELLVLDVSDKKNPVAVGFFNAPGSANFGYGYAIDIAKNNIYFGRSYVNNAPEFYMLDGINPATNLPILGSKDIGTSANPDSINGVIARDYLAFLLTNKQFQIWDVADPNAIAPWSSDGTSNTFLSLADLVRDSGYGLAGSVALYCSGNYFYVAVQTSSGNNDVLSIIKPN